MNIQQTIDLGDEILSKGSPEAAMEDPKLCAKIEQASDDLDETCLTAANFLQTKMTEENLAKLIYSISNSAIAKAVVGNGDSSLLISQGLGELRLYTEIVLFGIIGLLLEDEILRQS